MTHILTHNRKYPVGNNGVYSTNDLLILEQKAPESLENQGLDGFCNLRNQQVVCSSHITSSIKIRQTQKCLPYFYGYHQFVTFAFE